MVSKSRRRARLLSRIFEFGMFVIAAAASAQPIQTVGAMLDQLASQVSRSRSYVVIPVAGHVTGAGGTEFRSDVTVVASVPQRVAVAWLAQGVDNSAEPLDFFEVGPDPAFFPDMIAATLGKSGLGALVVVGVTAEGAFDPNARLRAFARVWTPVPGCSGTSSLSMTGSSFVPPSYYSYLTGLILDAGHRGTVGVVNPEPLPIRAIAHIFRPDYSLVDEVEIVVPGRSMKQVPMPAADAGPVAVWIEVHDFHRFAAYATSVDQASGDAWLLSVLP